MEQTKNVKKGTLRVSENVIITIAKNAAAEVSGIHSIAEKTFNISSLLNANTDPSDISVTMLDGVAKITMSVIVKNGYNVVNVCEQIQERVKSSVQSMTGVTVSKVDISVVDVDFETSVSN